MQVQVQMWVCTLQAGQRLLLAMPWFSNKKSARNNLALFQNRGTAGQRVAARPLLPAQCGWAWKALLAIFQPPSVLSSTK